MKSIKFRRVMSLLLSLITVIGLMSIPISASARYAEGFHGSYEDLGCAEDAYDCIEPDNDRFEIVSPRNITNQYDETVFTGTYQEVQNYLDTNGMTDGLPIIPPTWIKIQKFLQYTPYEENTPIATVNGRSVTPYQIAANAVMSGAFPESTPVCIAFVQALENKEYLDSLKSGELTPMMYVNGPISRQINIDNGQGMTTEELNYSIARFMELALINLAGIERTNTFGHVQPLVFSEDEQSCLDIGWQPRHVEQGYDLNDNVITATSFSMWGNNVTPATDLPVEIMKVLAWDITEKNLGGLGGKSVEDNADTHRLIFITPSVASTLAKKYKTKDALENALIENARRPLWMRTFAYYYSNTGGALSKSFNDVYNELKSSSDEDAKTTASPTWMNGITYANIDTVATMKKGNTDIIIHGDKSRNKTQVIPGGVSVSQKIELDQTSYDALVTSMNYHDRESELISATDTSIKLPSGDGIPSAVSATGTYRITASSSYAKSNRAIYYESATSTLYYGNGTSAQKVVLDTTTYRDFIAFVEALGVNSRFAVSNNAITSVDIRFSSNKSLPNKNAVAFASFAPATLAISANVSGVTNAQYGGASLDGAVITMNDNIKSFTAGLEGTVALGDSTNSKFVKVNNNTVTVDPTVEAGATAVIGVVDGKGAYRTMTFVNGGDGTYNITFNTANTMTLSSSSYYLKGEFNNWDTTDAFEKTDNNDIVALTKDISAGTYEFRVHDAGTDSWYGNSGTFTDTANRWMMNSSSNCTLVATGGRYEFKYEISTNKLSVYKAQEVVEITPPTEAPTQKPTQAPTVEPTQAPTEATTQKPTEAPTSRVIRVGVISYLGDTVPTLHYWNNSTGLQGDATLVASGETKQFSVGSGYWSDPMRTFKIYTTEVPVAANGMKTYYKSGNSNWAEEEVNPNSNQILLLFEYGGKYHNVLDTYSAEPSTEAPTVAPVKDYYLFGYINGANYGCEEDYANIGDYKFVDGKLTVTFDEASYVGVKTGDNANWYMCDGWPGIVNEVKLYNSTQLDVTADKLMVPAGEVEFTLVENADGTLTLSYTAEELPTIPEPTTEEPTVAPTEPVNPVTINFAVPRVAPGRTEWKGVDIYYGDKTSVNILPRVHMQDTGEVTLVSQTSLKTLRMGYWAVYTVTLTPEQVTAIDSSKYRGFVATANYNIKTSSLFDILDGGSIAEFNGKTFMITGANTGTEIAAYTGEWKDVTTVVQSYRPSATIYVAVPKTWEGVNLYYGSSSIISEVSTLPMTKVEGKTYNMESVGTLTTVKPGEWDIYTIKLTREQIKMIDSYSVTGFQNTANIYNKTSSGRNVCKSVASIGTCNNKMFKITGCSTPSSERASYVGSWIAYS